MSRVDIVLVKPGSQKQLYGELGTLQLTAIEPPLWGAVLAGFLREQGYSVVLYDAEVENWDYEETARKIQEVNPRLAAIVVSGTNPSASTMNMVGAGKIVSLVHQLDPAIKTLMTGLHPSALPERTITEEEVDFVCQGEGFYTLGKLLDALKNNADEFPIEGLWYKRNGCVVSNPRPSLVKDLDDIPQPAWDLLDVSKYRAHNWHCFEHIDKREPYAVIYTSLGCPFRCSFCCINALFGKPGIRYRSPELVLNEIDYLVSTYDVKNIKIIDEMFALNNSHVSRLCDLIVDRGYNLNMWAYARVDTVNRKMLRKMKQAGINWVVYGFESASERVLKGVTKGYKTDTVDEVVRVTYDEGLGICANYVFGLPDDDYDSMQETLDMALESNAEWANFYCAMAYPGSRLYEQALAEGWPLPDSWSGFSQHGFDTQPLPTRFLTPAEVLAFRDKAFNVYFGNEKYLNMIDKSFGKKVREHVEKMLAIKIKRKLLSDDGKSETDRRNLIVKNALAST